MRLATRNQLSLLAGLLIAALLVGVAWMFFISSQNDKTSSVRSNISDLQLQTLQAQHTLNALKADSVNLSTYKAQLVAAQQALPTTPAIPAFLRELHTIGDLTAVGISSVAIQPPVAVVASASGSTGQATTSGNAAYQISITVIAAGPSNGVTAFIKELQQLQSRAVLLNAVSEAGTTGGKTQVTLGMQVFVVPVDGKAPTVTN